MSINTLTNNYLRKREIDIQALKNRYQSQGFGGNYMADLYRMDLNNFENYLNEIWSKEIFPEHKKYSHKKLKKWEYTDIKKQIRSCIDNVPHTIQVLFKGDPSTYNGVNIEPIIASFEKKYGTYDDKIDFCLIDFRKEYNGYYSQVKTNKKSLCYSKLAIFISLISSGISLIGMIHHWSK